MTQRRFRHLPVLAEQTAEEAEDEDAPSSAVVGLLDITKCVFDRLDDLEKKVTEDNNIIQAIETVKCLCRMIKLLVEILIICLL
jgi:hypothetical protein